MPIGTFKDFGACVSAQKAKGKSDESARKICGHIEKMSKKKEGKTDIMKKNTKISKLKIDKKEEDNEFCTRGFIATTHVDDVGDMVPRETLDSWATQINENKTETATVSIHHDRDDVNLIAMGENAKVEKLDDGEFGLWVETHYNKTHPEFEDIKYQVDNDFITNYSIEYNTDDNSTTHKEQINGEWVRVLDPTTELVGYGLASPRTAVNKEAKLYKEIIKINKTQEVNKMDKKEDEKPVEEEKKEEVKTPEKTEDKEETEEKPEEKKEESKPEEKDEEEEGESKEKVEIKEKVIQEMIRKEVKEMNKKQPLIKDTKEKIEIKEINDYTTALKEGGISEQYRAAGRLHSFLESKDGIKSTYGRDAQSMPFECKEAKDGRHIIELKAADKGHIIPDNYTGAQTTWANIYANYEQYPAELNAIYQPVIINHLNDAITTFNLLEKVDFSNAATITFIARDTRNTDVGGYTEATAVLSMTHLDFDGHVGKLKCQQIFSYYKADVSVSGPFIALNQGSGGIGDVYADEIKWSTVDLMKAINQAILGNGAGTAEDAALGFEQLFQNSGTTLYGRAVNTYTTLKSAGYDNMSSAAITLKKMRAMIRACVQNGARKQDLVFICDHLQEDFVKGLIQDMQRITPTSGRVGFSGNIELDGVPIFADVDCNDDDLFLTDTAHTKIGMKLPPTYEELGKQGDSRRGIIKTYFNLYSTAPNHNYWIYGLATS